MVILHKNGFLGNPFQSREDVIQGLTSREQHHDRPVRFDADRQYWMRLVRTHHQAAPLSTLGTRPRTMISERCISRPLRGRCGA